MTNELAGVDPNLQRFQAVAEETRFRLVQILSRGERCVCDLQVELGAAQSLLSFHLKKLKEAGVISGRREGRWVHYSLIPEVLEEMRAFLGEVTPATRRPEARHGSSDCCG
jgi:ArsR family transcriptional regulator